MARASTPTLLALDYYSAILGIPPAAFNQGISDVMFPLTAKCPQIWMQYSWQRYDSVSREDLALELANAERDIADVMGWWPGRIWIEQEVHRYPQYHRRDMYGIGGRNVRSQGKSIKLNYGKVISPGQRQVDEISLANAVGYSGTYSEIATVTFPGITETTNACELKVYFAGHGGDPEWEIRPARTKTLITGTFTATFWAWQLIDPDLWEAIPTVTVETPTVDLDDAVYELTADIYYEYTDTSATSAVFYWEPQPPTSSCSFCLGVGCAACALTTQDGCFHIRDAERGVAVPTPGTYEDGAWASAAYSVCRDPEQVKLYYSSGNLDKRYLDGSTCEPLSDWWAQTIAYLATARLERPFCHCGNAEALASLWREDLALSGEVSYNVPFETLDNPFGTRRGEVMAWQRVSRIARGRQRGATAI